MHFGDSTSSVEPEYGVASSGNSENLVSGTASSPRVVIISGLSGSGKSTVVKALEDIGYFCIDNLPVPLLPKVLELASTRSGSFSEQPIAFVVDTRERDFLDDATEMIEQLAGEGIPIRVLFLEAEDDVLVRRYSETRRRHPMSDGGTVREGIRRERERLTAMRERADVLVNTSEHTVHTLKALVQDLFGGERGARLAITLLSFGYKYGVPPECDLLFDLRFLPNPYFVDHLRPQTGLEDEVSAYVLGWPEAGKFISHFQELAEFMLPLYEREGKSYLTIGLGCTGGQHRSVAISESLCRRLKGRPWSVDVRHRELGRILRSSEE